jgi:hypothetical protein
MRQDGHFLAYVLEFVISQATGFLSMYSVTQPQQLGDFVQTKAQPLGRFHKAHPRYARLAIPANAAKAPTGGQFESSLVSRARQ